MKNIIFLAYFFCRALQRRPVQLQQSELTVRLGIAMEGSAQQQQEGEGGQAERAHL